MTGPEMEDQTVPRNPAKKPRGTRGKKPSRPPRPALRGPELARLLSPAGLGVAEPLESLAAFAELALGASGGDPALKSELEALARTARDLRSRVAAMMEPLAA